MASRRTKHRRPLPRWTIQRAQKFGAVVLLMAAAVYAVTLGAQRAVDQAERLRNAELAAARVETSQAHLNQAMILAVDLADERATETAFTTALDQARRSLTVTRSTVTTVIPVDSGEYAAVEASLQEGFVLLDLLASGDLAGAEQLAGSSLTDSLQALAGELSVVVALEREALERTRSWTGLSSNLAGFAVALFLPGVLILGYWALAGRRVARERERARERARQAELESQLELEREINAAKDEFIANVSHELRTPLTAIHGFAVVLEEGMIQDPETGLELVNLIIGQTTELSRMVEDLLTTSRADSGMLTFKLENIDIKEEVDKVVPSFQRMGAAITVSCPSVTVFADPLRVRQILRNLIANACAHGGNNVDVSAVRAGPLLTLWVADDGPGVSDQVKDRLFERYVHQGDLPLQIGSVGLGLAIARVLAREMGGDIRYERASGRTYFVLELPVSAGEDRPPADEVRMPKPIEAFETGHG